MIVIDEDLLEHFRTLGACEWCGRACGRLEPHHLFRRGFGGGTRLDVRINLAGLCRECHHNAENGTREMSRREALDYLLQIVARREKTFAAAIEAEIYRLRREPRYGSTGASDGQGPPRDPDQWNGLPRPEARGPKADVAAEQDSHGWHCF